MRRRKLLQFFALPLFGALPLQRARAQEEISATLELSRDEVASGQTIEREISGDGHTHRVRVADGDLETLWNEGQVVLRSGPALDGRDRHDHWVRVSMR